MSYTNIYYIDLSLVTYHAFSIWLLSSINLSMHPLGTLTHSKGSAHSNRPISMSLNGRHVVNTKHKLHHGETWMCSLQSVHLHREKYLWPSSENIFKKVFVNVQVPEGASEWLWQRVANFDSIPLNMQIPKQQKIITKWKCGEDLGKQSRAIPLILLCITKA